MKVTAEVCARRLTSSVAADYWQVRIGEHRLPSLAVFACAFALLTSLAASASGQVILSPNKLIFDCRSGHQCGSQTTTLTNEGTGALTISSIAITGKSAGFFVQANTCGTELKAGASCRITVSTTPMPKGKFTGTLIVNDSAPNSPQKALLEVMGS